MTDVTWYTVQAVGTYYTVAASAQNRTLTVYYPDGVVLGGRAAVADVRTPWGPQAVRQTVREVAKVPPELALDVEILPHEPHNHRLGARVGRAVRASELLTNIHENAGHTLHPTYFDDLSTIAGWFDELAGDIRALVQEASNGQG